MALMNIIDQYHDAVGLVLMAATNRVDSLTLLLREGRFDRRLRLDLPHEAERERIFATTRPLRDLTYMSWRGFCRELVRPNFVPW